MESKYSAGLCLYRVAVVSLFKFTLSALPLQRQRPGSCCSISYSIADEGDAWKARWEGESSSICSRVMKERWVVMKERAIPGPCNCCPRGPRIQYYSMGLAIWTDCIPKRDIYIYIYKHTISTQYSAITCLALRRSAIKAGPRPVSFDYSPELFKIWHMHLQCVPGSLLATHAARPRA